MNLSPTCLLNLKIISDVQLSPDNQTVLFVAKEAKMSENQNLYQSNIYQVRAGKQELFLTSAMQPRFSPDGQWIAFLRESEGAKNLCIIPSKGGEITPLVQNKYDVQTFRFSPDSRFIAFVMQEDINEKQKASYEYAKETNINRLWLIELSSRQLKKLTDNNYHVRGTGDFGTINEEFDFSPNGKEITFSYAPGSGFDYFFLDGSLATIDLTSGHISTLKKQAPLETLPHYSPDGKWIAFVVGENEKRFSTNRRIMVYSVLEKSYTLLAPTFNEGPFLSGPHFLGWTEKSDALLFFEPKGTKYQLVLLPLNGHKAQEIDTKDYFFTFPSLSYDKKHLVFVSQSPKTPPEVYTSLLHTFQPKQISELNQEFLGLPQPKTEKITWKSSDSLEIEGLLTYPMNYSSGKKYPLLLCIHGGPMGFFDETYLGTPYPYPYASFAENGFFILRPNPRGSCGYGRAFRVANYSDWGGKDFEDLMTGVDHLIEKGLVDPEQMGVMGWSYGGYLTAWTIAQTNRFKKASMGAGLSNLISMMGTSDLPRFLPDYLETDFWTNPTLYQERSPLYDVPQISTPCLIQHGLEDKRVPVSQSLEFYHALKSRDKNVLLMLYPHMGHRPHTPKMYLDLMEQNLEWFLRIKQ